MEHPREDDAVAAPRFVVGIDLGTTNSAVAYADLREDTATGAPRVRVFDVPQVVAEGEVVPRTTLPSFLFLLDEAEQRARRVTVPWGPAPRGVAGVWARDQGALVPGRQVSSAKSWLCNDLVDRRASLLPWGADEGAPSCSPVDASAAYLAHVREAWNHTFAAGRAGASLRFEHQAVVLTVPASFDEEARELTVEAAGALRLSLIEEPTAALYAWLAAQRHPLAGVLRDGDRILVCDVGGGTTDFTLVAVRLPEGGNPVFERTAVGHHLLLGGDNLDLALVKHVEEKLGRPRLTLRQQQALRRQCAAAKERLLGPPPEDRVPIAVLGGGASVVGGALATDLSRSEVLAILLDGFLPFCEADAVPATDRRGGLRELGLPYAADAAITRHLAAFLREAAGDGADTRPHAVLFNGGFFTPEETRARVADVLASWFGETPRVLANASPATAVAEGAAYFGLAARGHGIRIGGGSPRAYYLGVGGEAEAPAPDGHTPAAQGATNEGLGQRAVCVLPRGTEEGAGHTLDRAFTVAANRPLSFTLFSSLTRKDAAGAVVTLGDDVHRHAPLVTELRFGKRSRQPDVRVGLEIRYTELGTLELWLHAPDTGHRWRLQFQLRAAARGEEAAAPTATIAPDALAAATERVEATFGPGAHTGDDAPSRLMGQLESVLGFGKHAWPVAAVRPLADLLLERIQGRRLSARHEARWLNLFGYCMRPGFGATRDEWRMSQSRRVYLEGLVFANDVQCQVEWLVLWQRVAGGLTAGQQQELFARHAALVGLGGKKTKWLPPQVQVETLRLLASLEHVPAQRRAALGDDLVARLEKERRGSSLLWAVGRTGARVPFHGPLNTAVPAARAHAWAHALLDALPISDDVVAAVTQLAARTGDPVRDLDEDACQALVDRLRRAGVADDALRPLLEIAPRSEESARRAFGESLPEGLRLAE